jgi:hypothetical protein
MRSARYAALSRHLALLAIARRIVLKSIGAAKGDATIESHVQQ